MELYRYRKFTNLINESNENIHSICDQYSISHYKINKDKSIDVNTYVNLEYFGFDKLPLKFNIVEGYFRCNDNALTSLEGSPKKVNGNFYCYGNKLTDLKGAPKEVTGHFNCTENKLKKLEGCPEEISGDFACYDNELITLEGSPKEVGGHFNCANNQLTSLEGAPKKVGTFNCYKNNIKDVKGFNTRFEDLIINHNPIEELMNLFPKERWWEVIQSLNEHDVIRDGKVIILQALELVYDDLGLEVPEELYEKEFKNYEVR